MVMMVLVSRTSWASLRRVVVILRIVDDDRRWPLTTSGIRSMRRTTAWTKGWDQIAIGVLHIAVMMLASMAWSVSTWATHDNNRIAVIISGRIFHQCNPEGQKRRYRRMYQQDSRAIRRW